MTISVIIPSYNRASLVGATLESVLAQSRPADEVLVVDDGSTDDTAAVVAGYGTASGGQVRYHRQRNAGPSAARNTGVSLTRGASVLLLDSDDLLLPGALGALGAALASAPDAPLAYCRAELIGWDGSGQGDWTPGNGYHAGEVWEALLRDNFIRSPGAALVRRCALEAAGPWDEATRKNEDWDMWLRLAEAGPFLFVDEALLQYRMHPASASGDLAAMHRESMRMYDALRHRYRADPGRSQALKAAISEARAAEPLYLLALARLDLREGRPRAAFWKAVRALLRRPGFLADPRLKRQLLREWRQSTS